VWWENDLVRKLVLLSVRMSALWWDDLLFDGSGPLWVAETAVMLAG
jgi:hypothetical protein